MAFFEPLFRLSPKGSWELPKRVCLSILSFYMMTKSLFTKIFPTKRLVEADRAKRSKFINKIQGKCKRNALRSQERFLPKSMISSLVTEAAVKSLMPGASPDLIQFVCKRAQRAFLTTLHINHDKVHAAMSSFFAHRMTDDKLPIEDPTKPDGACRPLMEGGCHHQTFWPHFSDWECCDVLAFHRDQWIFCAPVFNKAESPLELEDSHILPFTSKERSGKGGHFSTVWKAGIHVDHYPDSSKVVNGEIQVALKELKDLNESGYNVRESWMSEVKALDQINKLNLKHLIRRTGAFKKGDSYYIMFEWADGGNLRDLWQKMDAGGADLNGRRIMKVLEQLHGLAKALSKLHNTGNRTPEITPKPFARAETLLPSSSEGMPKIQVQADDGSNTNTNKTGEEHWRHGDLKPDNILLFNDASSPWLGTLKIADLGLAKQHEFATAKRVEATGQRYSTSQYEAPEVVIKRDAPRSRLYDIWSMGCIIFEFVIWLLYGSAGLQKFYSENPQTVPGIGTLYFTAPTGDSAHVSNVVKRWMDHILRSDPECNGKSPSALGDLVRLVKDHLLVVALPWASVRTRGDAELLESSLKQIMEKARADRGGTYLFTGANRRGVQPPQKMGPLSTGFVGQIDVSRGQHLDVGAAARRRDPSH